MVAREPYTQWVLERVRIVKLPFDIDPTYTPDIPNPLLMSVEEIEEIKDALEQAQRDKDNLEHNLYNLAYEKNQLQGEFELKDQQIQSDRELTEKERSK